MARDIPIIFSAPMVLALLAGRKTQTRRLAWRTLRSGLGAQGPSPWQKVQPDDRLWVRETIATTGAGPVRYAATDVINDMRKKTPAIHMPRWASRLTLAVTAVKVEPLQTISKEDAIAEGIAQPDLSTYWTAAHLESEHDKYGLWSTPTLAYEHLWRALHGADSWNANPEVVALTFEVHKGNIDALGS